MAVCAAEHHACKVGLRETGDTALTGRGIPQGGGNVLQGSGSSDTTVWFGDVGPFGSNGEEGRRDTHRVPQTYHWEASVEVRRRDVGYARGGSIVGIRGNAVGDDLYRETAGMRGKLGGVATTIQSVCKVEGLRRGWTHEGGLVVPRGNIETALFHLVRNLTGG